MGNGFFPKESAWRCTDSAQRCCRLAVVARPAKIQVAPRSATRALIRVPLLFSVPNMGPTAHLAETPTSCRSALRTAAELGFHVAEVRAKIALADVLDLIGFVACVSSGDQMRGPCPVHHSSALSTRGVSANLRLHIYKCFGCGSSVDQLDRYASVRRLSLSSGRPTRCASSSTVRFGGCSLGHWPGLGQPIASPRSHGAVASPAGDLARSLGVVDKWRRNRWAGTHWSPRWC